MTGVSTTTTTRYEIVGTTQDVTQCDQCGRNDLRGTIVLAVLEVTINDATGAEEWNHTGDIVHYGSDCGAKAVGYGPGKGRALRKEAEIADRAAAREAEMLAERRSRYRRALDTLAFDNEIEAGKVATAQLGQIRRTFHQMGGYDALGAFPAWVAKVAETGTL